MRRGGRVSTTSSLLVDRKARQSRRTDRRTDRSMIQPTFAPTRTSAIMTVVIYPKSHSDAQGSVHKSDPTTRTWIVTIAQNHALPGGEGITFFELSRIPRTERPSLKMRMGAEHLVYASIRPVGVRSPVEELAQVGRGNVDGRLNGFFQQTVQREYPVRLDTVLLLGEKWLGGGSGLRARSWFWLSIIYQRNGIGSGGFGSTRGPRDSFIYPGKTR